MDADDAAPGATQTSYGATQALSLQSDTLTSFRNETSQLYHSLLVHWRNETSAPEILQYEQEVAEGVRELLREMEDKTLPNEAVGCTLAFGADHLIRCERERLRYMLIAYLRVRLVKVERLAEWLLLPENAAVQGRLSDSERDFLQNYAALARPLEQALLRAPKVAGPDAAAPAAVAAEVPAELAAVEQSAGRRAVSAPVLWTPVFVQFREDLGEVTLAAPGQAGHVEDIRKGDLFVVRYDAVRHWVESGTAVLL
eukprot:TRINITY_DN16713_c2_g1_i1.p1 TRINITY_DN16713_c2_g1~~TRINITY_DN16713_c2_g1_i1.p1  ORF type:complete len:286 (+),score=81.26 TRINITY_DN16713_c2_g1_i1:94-858(+)